MSGQCEVVKGGTGSVASYGGNCSPAARSVMAAMFAVSDSVELVASKATEALAQMVGHGGGAGKGNHR